MKSMRAYGIVAGMMLVLVVWSCSDTALFFDSRPVPDYTWHMHDTVRFEAAVSDTSRRHQIHISIRNTTDYPYSNLYMFMDVRFPNGTTFRDTLECILAQNDGKWTGKGFGKIRENVFLFRDNVWFPDTGIYVFSLVHGMREDALRGIADVGLRINKK